MMASASLADGRPRRRWYQLAEALPGVRHYLYPLHRTGAYLAPPSLAARLYLLLLRWVNRTVGVEDQLIWPRLASEKLQMGFRCKVWRSSDCDRGRSNCTLSVPRLKSAPTIVSFRVDGHNTRFKLAQIGSISGSDACFEGSQTATGVAQIAF